MTQTRDGAPSAEDDAPSCPESEASTAYVTIHNGDALDELRKIPDASIDAICTDPPYGLAEHKPERIALALSSWLGGDREHVPDGRGFMGRSWDAFVPPPAIWDECLRVLKPGGHLVAFAGSRTVDLMTMSIRLAGFEIRDGLTWLYGSGFPKSLDVSKAIDKAAGAEREVIGLNPRAAQQTGKSGTAAYGEYGGAHEVLTAPATPAAEQWQGWGTALKPASEPIIVARKPLGGTVAANVLAHGTGALNIDGTRVAGDVPTTTRGHGQFGVLNDDGWKPSQDMQRIEPHAGGRWPSNVLLTHGPDCGDVCTPGCPVAELDAQSGIMKDGTAVQRNGGGQEHFGGSKAGKRDDQGYGGSGGASRFFPAFRYQAKAPTRERPKVDGVAHPTVKPLELMRWLVRLVTPPGGTVLDPFAGSGTTLQAAREEGFASIGIEREPTYLPLIAARLGIEIEVPEIEPVPVYDALLVAIGEALDRDALIAIRRANRATWTDEHDEAAKARLARLAQLADGEAVA